MLAIRLQRLGRKKYPVYRVAVQEAQRHPSSGRVVAYVGSYNPHTKTVSYKKKKVEKKLNPWFWGDVVATSLVSTTTDAVTGAMWKYDENVSLDCN